MKGYTISIIIIKHKTQYLQYKNSHYERRKKIKIINYAAIGIAMNKLICKNKQDD